jgi:glycosyltransferase involved in cell wall biosynthesis
MPSIDLLISTMNYRPGVLDKLLATVPEFVNVIIINQKTEASECEAQVQLKPNATCHSFRERGLSRSRNRLISLATSDVVVISDDDVEFVPDAFEHVAEAFSENPGQDILTFKMLKPNGEPRKRYKSYPYQHNSFSIAKVSSCEIALRRERLRDIHIGYDESFGLGARYPMGEEVVFLMDCLKGGLKIRFIPIVISCHPEESTGRNFTTASEKTRGALFYRLYGPLSYLIGCLLYFRKRHMLARTIGYGVALRAYSEGIHDCKEYYKKKLPDQFICAHTD